MKSEEFIKLAELYGFAPSRALRELLEAVERMEREACAKVCDTTPPYPFRPSIEAAHAIRARGQA